MKARLPLLLSLGSSLTYLVTLYLPWESLGRIGDFTGWSIGTGDIGALIAPVVIGFSVASLVRTGLADRVPLGRATLALSALAIGGFITIRAAAGQRIAEEGLIPPIARHGVTAQTAAHYDYGAYLALACGIALLVASAMPWTTKTNPQQAAAILLAVGLVVSLAVLPWRHLVLGHIVFSTFALEGTPGALAVAAVSAGIATPARRAGERLFWFGTTALFAVAAAGPGNSVPGLTYRYGAWLGIGLAVALIVLAAPSAVEASSRWCITRRTVLAAAPAALLLAALFAPWEKACYPVGHTYRQLSGACLYQSGWTFSVGPPLGVLAVILLAGVLLARARLPLIELGVFIALLTATLALQTQLIPAYGFSYGAYVGFVSAGLVLALVLSQVRVRRVVVRRVLILLFPIVASLACVALVFLPVWDVMPLGFVERFRVVSNVGWLAITFAMLGVWLLGAWLRRLAGPTRMGVLVLAPAGMVAVLSLSLVRSREVSGTSWIGWILLALPAFLLACGWIEERRGLDRLRIPEEIWRVDRLPPVKD